MIDDILEGIVDLLQKYNQKVVEQTWNKFDQLIELINDFHTDIEINISFLNWVYFHPFVVVEQVYLYLLLHQWELNHDHHQLNSMKYSIDRQEIVFHLISIELMNSGLNSTRQMKNVSSIQ